MTQISHAATAAPENARSTASATAGQPSPERRGRWRGWRRRAAPKTSSGSPQQAAAPVNAGRPPRAGQAAGDRRIRRSSVVTILLVATVGTAISSWHAYELVHAAGEPMAVALGYPLLIDGVIFMASMNILQAARRGRDSATGRPVLAWLTLFVGALVTLAVNVAYGWDRGLVSQLTSAIPPLAVIVSYELLMKQIRQAAADAEQIEVVDPPAGSHPQPPAGAVAEPAATPAPVARTLADAVLAARAEGASIRGLAAAFETTRSRVEKIIRQAEGDDDEAADEDAPAAVEELIEQILDDHEQPPVNGAAVPGARVARSGLGGGV
ncbi:DUF2637 domain-containing protein [Nonomuraea sp. NPDC050328]|uniref:DUF2637 domain-containing protein n=1 Tax=Nonomuraea sp. NPDC050328 TaxID=3364361 RepID=UPI0037A5126C